MAEITILETVRDAVKVPDDSYDTDLLIKINSVVFGLYQLGAIAYKVVTPTTLWTDLAYTRANIAETVKAVIGLRVKYQFDTTVSQQPILAEAVAEYESRILIELDLNPANAPGTS